MTALRGQANIPSHFAALNERHSNLHRRCVPRLFIHTRSIYRPDHRPLHSHVIFTTSTRVLYPSSLVLTSQPGPPSDTVTALHILAVCPAYSRRDEHHMYIVAYRRRLYIPIYSIFRNTSRHNTMQRQYTASRSHATRTASRFMLAHRIPPYAPTEDTAVLSGTAYGGSGRGIESPSHHAGNDPVAKRRLTPFGQGHPRDAQSLVLRYGPWRGCRGGGRDWDQTGLACDMRLLCLPSMKEGLERK
jgi:hypothetical protein